MNNVLLLLRDLFCSLNLAWGIIMWFTFKTQIIVAVTVLKTQLVFLVVVAALYLFSLSFWALSVTTKLLIYGRSSDFNILLGVWGTPVIVLFYVHKLRDVPLVSFPPLCVSVIVRMRHRVNHQLCDLLHVTNGSNPGRTMINLIKLNVLKQIEANTYTWHCSPLSWRSVMCYLSLIFLNRIDTSEDFYLVTYGTCCASTCCFKVLHTFDLAVC